MKNWKKASIGALCVLSLLAGCAGGSKDDTAENSGQNSEDRTAEFSLDRVREVNAPLALLEKHDTVTVSMQGTDGDGNETYTAKLQYTRDADGKLVCWSHYQYTENSGAGQDEMWGQANGAVYAARMASSGDASLNCYPSGEYESYIQAMLPSASAGNGDEETIDEQSVQDGAIVSSTTTTYTGVEGYFSTTLYYTDPVTDELLAMSVTDYSTDENGEKSALGTTLYNWSYDETYAPEHEVLGEVLLPTGAADVCDLTFICAPGAANEETQEISVKRGTYITFVNSTGCLLYADKELTQMLDDTQSIDTSGESMTVYVVPMEG